MKVDLNLDKLVKATEGYTGAEIVQICQSAKDEAMAKEIEAVSNGISEDVLEEGMLGMDDFEIALNQTPRGVTKEMLTRYETFAAKASMNH